MKKILAIIAVFAFFGITTPSYSQSTASKVGHSIKKGAKKAGHGIKKGAKAVGNETAELATKGKAKVTDKESEEFVGPDNQKIYVDDGTKYYWINEKGGRVFVTKDELKPKVKEE